MDPLLPTLTGHSPRDKADTPQTHDLEHLRAKRVAYYESIGIIKSGSSKLGHQPVSTASQDTKGKPSENQTKFKGLQKSPHYSSSGKKSLLYEESQVVTEEAEQGLGQRVGTEHRRRSCPTELDLQMLADTSVPETQKLQHVINWAQKFISNSPEEQGLKSSKTSFGLLHSNHCQSAKAVGSQKDVHLRSSDSPPLLREGQASPQIDLHSFRLSPSKNLSSEFSSSFVKVDFPGSGSCGCQETTVKNEREGRAAESLAASFKQADSAQQEYDPAGNRHLQNPNKEDTFPERVRVQTQLRDTSEERKVVEETGQSLPRNGYFWTPLSDSSEEECLDERGASKGPFRREVQCRKYKEFVGVALSSTSDSTPVSQTTMLENGVSSPLEADMKGNFRGTVPTGTPQGVPAEFKADSSKGQCHIVVPIRGLPGVQLMTPSDSSKGRGKASDNMRFTLGSRDPDTNSRNEWKRGSMGREEEALLRRAPRGSQNNSVQRWVESSPPVITQGQSDLTHPGSCPAPQIDSSSFNLLEDPLENVSVHEHWDSDVFRAPTADSHRPWFSQLPPPGANSPSGRTPPGVMRDMSQEQKQKAMPSSNPVSRDISENGLKGSFLPQEAGGGPSWSVLETYFYYLHMLKQIRGHSSEENSSLPFQGPGLSESELMVPSLEGKGGCKRASLDRDTEAWKDESESDVAAEGEGDIHPQGRGCAEEAAQQETSFWKPQSNYGKLCSTTPKMTSRITSYGGYREMSNAVCSSHIHGDVTLRSQNISRTSLAEAEERTSTEIYPRAFAVGSVEKFFCKNVPQDVERENEEHKRDTVFSRWLLLPDEIWICVFSLLSHKELARVAQVCHRFHRLASDETLWKQIRIIDCLVLKDDWLLALARCHPRSLTLHRCRDDAQAVTEDGLKRLFQHCRDFLQELNVTSCSGPGLRGDKVLLQAGALCKRLTAVDISWSGATDVGVMALIEGTSSLQGLSINGCQVTDKAIKALVKKHGNSLHRIEVFGCLALTDRSIGSLAPQCSRLRTLNVGRVPKVSEACLVQSLQKLRAVTALNVAGLKMVRDRIVHLMVTQCPKLESLVLSSCSQVTDVSLVEISTYLPTLRICSLANYCHISLECVKLSFCKNVPLDVVQKLCKNCRRLKILHLYGCTITPTLSKIKEAYKRVKVFHDISAPTC